MLLISAVLFLFWWRVFTRVANVLRSLTKSRIKLVVTGWGQLRREIYGMTQMSQWINACASDTGGRSFKFELPSPILDEDIVPAYYGLQNNGFACN